MMAIHFTMCYVYENVKLVGDITSENGMVSIYGSTALVDLGRFFSSLILYTVGRAPCTSDHSFARPLPTHRTTQTQNQRAQTSMLRVGFVPTTPVLERAKTFHALDRATAVIGESHGS
jgi:hypothetical protein